MSISKPIFYLSAVFCGLVTLSTAFKSQPDTTAVPAKQQGIDVYVMSEPSRPYEIIKTGVNSVLLTCKSSLNFPINQAAKYEGAQGVIIYFPQSDKYSIIKYKE